MASPPPLQKQSTQTHPGHERARGRRLAAWRRHYLHTVHSHAGDVFCRLKAISWVLVWNVNNKRKAHLQCALYHLSWFYTETPSGSFKVRSILSTLFIFLGFWLFMSEIICYIDLFIIGSHIYFIFVMFWVIILSIYYCNDLLLFKMIKIVFTILNCMKTNLGQFNV